MLRKQLALRTLSDIYRMIRTGAVRVNGKRAKENYRLQEGDELALDVGPQELAAQMPGEAPAVRDLSGTEFYKRNLKIVYEDEAIIACDKPPHLVVHPGSGHETGATLIDLVKCYMFAGPRPDPAADPVLVHRLDRDTSGIILIAKNKAVVRSLHSLLRQHRMTKQYSAVCHGAPPQKKGTIELRLAKTVEKNLGMKMSVADEGEFSKTDYCVLSSRQGLSKVQLTLSTGKTHQIRVHMAHIGCPIVGDVRYGDPRLDAAVFSRPGIPRRLYLHAGLLSFVHPLDNKKITLTVPEPGEFSTVFGCRD
jgi:23S rRNA pseudouridine955/2504/2580 synthase